MNGNEAMDGKSPDAAELRCKAEQRLGARETQPSEGPAVADAMALVHELQVHQIELEMQNEELLRARAAAEEASQKYGDLFDFAPVGYYLWNHAGRILEVNLAGAAILGLDRGAVIQKRFGQFVAAECRARFADFATRVLASDAKQTCEVKIHQDGQAVDVLIEGIAAQGGQGQSPLCRAAVIDLSQQKRADALAAANQALQSEIAAHRQTEEELQRAKVAAEEANVAKSQFLANMSHELRTPMNAIMGMVDLALREGLSLALRDYLQTAQQSADGLLELLNEILDFSRIEAGGFQLESVPFDLRKTLEQVVKTLGVRAYEKGLELTCDLDHVPTQLMGDPLRLRQVLINLVGNAIKFTSTGTVVVSLQTVPHAPGVAAGANDAALPVSPSGHAGPNSDAPVSPGGHAGAGLLPEGEGSVTLQFSVADTGVGIAPKDQERIFGPFTQADASTTRQYGGTGLGLTIARRLVDLMGGRMWVQSKAGEGSVFHFTVRLGLQQGPEQGPQPAAGTTVPPVPTAISPVPSRVLHLLLAEDTQANQKLVTYILNHRGHSVTVVENGQQACEAVQREEFDAVLMDVQMPVLDGFQATQAIRTLQDPKKARLPIVAMTAHALKGDADRCLAAGMNAYLSKPIKGEHLLAIVERLAEPTPGDPLAWAATPPATEAESVSVPACVFDLDKAVQRCFGKYAIFQDMVRCLFDEADPLLERMRTALADGNAVELRSAAHRLKGTVGYLGAAPATDAVKRVEHLGIDGELAGAAEAIRQIEEQLAILKQALGPYSG
jgi:PAS domain S-box-containing protein